MFHLNDLTHDQQATIDRLYENNETLLVANMGAGKTVCALTAIQELLDDEIVRRVLVVAPVKVCKKVWATEAANWAHLEGLTVADASGSDVDKRIAALESDARVVCINFENLKWLFKDYGAKEMFDGLVVDEVTKLKNTGGAQFKAIRPRLKDFEWRVGMTGTPVSENWIGLFGQMLVVDGGARLGTRKDGYLRKYFYPTDYNEYNWALYDWAPRKLAALISDIVYTMPDYRDQLPPLDDYPIPVYPPASLADRYDRLKADMLLEVEGETITADTAAVLSNKLMQMASGFLYGPPTPEGRRGAAQLFDDYKIDACARVVDDLLSSNRQVVICYWFDADLERLLKLYPGCLLSGENIDKWNAGDLDVLLLHPMSAGHGLNLAAGGADMLFIGPIWSRDLREQTIARLWRRGQTQRVRVRTLIASGTIDEVVSEREQGKQAYEALFKQHIAGG